MRNGNPSIVNSGTSSVNAPSMKAVPLESPAVNPAGLGAGDGGTDGQLYVPAMPEATAAEKAAETAHARKLAERYRLEFVDLSQFSIDHDLFRAIPADLMLRYGFVPYHREGHDLVIVVSDPTDLPMIDELAVLLATRIRV